jgi:transcriptional regulator with XRE-family HTH domain
MAMDVLDPAFPVLVRTARAILGWSQTKLAEKSKVSEPSISRLERLEGPGRPSNMLKIVRAFEEAGVRLNSDASGFGLFVSEKAAATIREEVRRHQFSKPVSSKDETKKPDPLSRVRGRRVNTEF